MVLAGRRERALSVTVGFEFQFDGKARILSDL
jgi:hypothetical protein